jgi:hypothetical protein
MGSCVGRHLVLCDLDPPIRPLTCHFHRAHRDSDCPQFERSLDNAYDAMRVRFNDDAAVADNRVAV